jgi:uncharacterized protein YegP (UPF0339 family)
MPAHYDLKKSDGQFMFNLKAGNRLRLSLPRAR